MAGTAIAVPTTAGLGKGLTNYGIGVIAGIGYRIISRMTGSGLIGGAISAAVVSAMVRGPAGEMIATITGFQTGQVGLEGLQLPGFLGGGSQRPENAIETI